jgi:hypothetical protein
MQDKLISLTNHLGSITDEDGCRSKTKHYSEKSKEQSCLFQQLHYRSKGYNATNLSFLQELVKMFTHTRTMQNTRMQLGINFYLSVRILQSLQSQIQNC